MRLFPTSGRRHRGAVLILVLVVLGLLALLAVSLATTSVLDRHVSHNYMDVVRARLVAKAGIEYATTQIQSSIQRGEYNDPAMGYWGLNIDEVGDPDLDTPLSLAANPSFAVENEEVQNPGDSNVTARAFTIDGRKIGISGTLTSGAYGKHSDIFRLRVSEANGRLFVNDGLKDPKVTLNLKRILNNLGDVCGVPEAGERLITSRPAHVGYRSKRELIEVLGEGNYRKLAHHLTLWAWADKDLVNPVPLSQETVRAYPVDYNDKIAIYRYGRSRDAMGGLIDRPLKFAPDFEGPTGDDHAIMALDELYAPWISRSSRAPVNVNIASEEILTSLIIGLRGWFVAERRKNNPGESAYSPYIYPKFANRPGGAPAPPWNNQKELGDEYGYLYSTVAFEGPKKETVTSTSGGGVEAVKVAKEIIACRNRKKSPTGQPDYANAWYGGPFRTWRQFNAFCDGLVTNGLLIDRRAIYLDYSGALGGGDTGSDETVPSRLQPALAAEALASVLKANFNPNCTLNELNPDRNLYLLIDKTDLICHSTEFCFTPMGFFDIESEGIVVRVPDSEDFLQTRHGITQARAMMECGVQLFEVIRESTQADFLKGNLGQPVRGTLTSSNRGLETGPEPDVGIAATECRWSGWIQLSTNGGVKRPLEPGRMVSTEPGPRELSATANAHYQFDHRLNFHEGGNTLLYEVSADLRNLADRTEEKPGPYAPLKGKYRLSQDWAQEDEPPMAAVRASSDLRIDGTYIERDSACMYRCDASVFGTQGTVSYWIKPSYRPEMTGKPRTYFSTEMQGPGSFPLMNGHWFFASHHDSPNTFNYWQGPWAPASFVVGYATVRPSGQGSRGGVGHMTNSLNVGGVRPAPSEVLFKHHEWIHASYMWDMDNFMTTIHLNGRHVETRLIHVHPGISLASDWTAENAVFRLGEPSRTMEYPSSLMHIWWGVPSQNPWTISRNWAADATMDELYLWKGNALATADQLFDRGRYSMPRPGREAVFTSQSLFEGSPISLKLPEPSTVRPPVVTSASDNRRTYSTATATASQGPDSIPILCAFWTWHPEFTEPREGRHQVHDYFSGEDIDVQVQLRFILDGQPTGEVLTDDGGSAIDNLVFTSGHKLQYQVKVVLPKAGPGSLILATPVIDDVTIFYTRGRNYLHFGHLEGIP